MKRLAIALAVLAVACTPAQLQQAASWVDLAAKGAQALVGVVDFCDDAGAAQDDIAAARELIERSFELAEDGSPEAEEALRLAVSATGSILQRLEARGVAIPPEIERLQRAVVGMIVVPRLEAGLDALHAPR